MQVVILAGGAAMRLRPLTQSIPKIMIPIAGKLFLEYQIELLKNSQITDIVLCTCYLREKIKNYFGNGAGLGMNILYSEEEYPLGTAGALRNAYPLLDDSFMLLDGDAYLPFKYDEIINEFRTGGKQGLMVVYKNNNRYDISNVAISGGLVTAYERQNKAPRMVYIHTGLSILCKKVLDLIPVNQFYQLDLLFHDLVKNGELLAYETHQRFYGIGSLSGLDEFKALVSAGQLPK